VHLATLSGALFRLIQLWVIAPQLADRAGELSASEAAMGTPTTRIAVRNPRCDFLISLPKICFRNTGNVNSVGGRFQLQVVRSSDQSQSMSTWRQLLRRSDILVSGVNRKPFHRPLFMRPFQFERSI